ncbi:hypothetical protein WA026_017449 [Henosepilachna vigintioctopunctata]|uniref:Uncharacterized protein n=1 Tax=Henosepilachna vigintioctopunctata TaxID=420089 RepID=A0AAW1VFC7_9CUCU
MKVRTREPGIVTNTNGEALLEIDQRLGSCKEFMPARFHDKNRDILENQIEIWPSITTEMVAIAIRKFMNKRVLGPDYTNADLRKLLE